MSPEWPVGKRVFNGWYHTMWRCQIMQNWVTTGSHSGRRWVPRMTFGRQCLPRVRVPKRHPLRLKGNGPPACSVERHLQFTCTLKVIHGLRLQWELQHLRFQIYFRVWMMRKEIVPPKQGYCTMKFSEIHFPNPLQSLSRFIFIFCENHFQCKIFDRSFITRAHLRSTRPRLTSPWMHTYSSNAHFRYLWLLLVCIRNLTPFETKLSIYSVTASLLRSQVF